MKRRVVYLVLLPLTVILLFPMTSNVLSSFVRPQGVVAETRPAQQHAVTHVTDSQRQLVGMRYQHHLRPVTSTEQGTSFQVLPAGVYGHSQCGDRAVKANPASESTLETHKRHDGIVYYVAYASREDIEKYLARKTNFHIRASSIPQGRTRVLFEIPVDFVAKCEVRRSEVGHIHDLFINRIPELYL